MSSAQGDATRGLDNPAARVVQLCFPVLVSLVVVAALPGCGAALAPAGVEAFPARDRRCTPTGWVDRIEEGLVVIESDVDDDSDDGQVLVLPLSCLPAPVRPGQHLVLGRFDPAGTRALARRIRQLTIEVMGESGQGAKPGSPDLPWPRGQDKTMPGAGKL